MIFVILAVSAFAAIIGLIIYARWNYGTLESLGFTVVKPLHVLLGNTADFHLKVTHLQDIEWFKQYGPVFGVYQGRQPRVHICDAELVKHIMIKDYDHFKDRREIDFGSPLLNEMPDFFRYDKWKAVRQLMTSSFTAAKLKLMSPSFKDSLADFAVRMKKETSLSKSEKIDIKQEIFTMLTDLIARSVFSIKIENGGDAENRFAKILTEIVQGEGGIDNNKSTFLKSLTYSFPFLERFTAPIFDPKASDEFIEIFKTIIDARKKSGEKQKDFVEMIIGLMDKIDTPEFKKNNITELTLFCQALVFFFAGQDQISTIASYAILSASKDKDIENKIIEEIDSFLEKYDGNIDYENIFELKYVQACIEEASRLVNFFIRAERICTQDWEKDGIKIKKGMMVVIPIWAANRNPEYFPDPEKFDPERFMPENKKNLHPCANMVFGHGPKNCIAVRFASDILLYTLVYMYKNFRFKVRQDSELKFYPGIEFMAVHGPIYLDLLVR